MEMGGSAVVLGIQLLVGAVATFLAILLWSRTRDAAWMFIVIGTVAHYGALVFSGLELLGLVDLDGLVFAGVPLGRVLISSAPMLFFICAFVIMVARNRV
ncbi:MAG: hypothetical protein EA383_00645 [Spirochaetaceae bacterium]|nr:MAG: hypothetical protein EA383_00645 [Spirochaetaceae bacterium]